MGVGDTILTVLCGGYGESYRLMRRQLYGGAPMPVSQLRHRVKANDNTLRVTLSRLKQNGLVENRDGAWALSKKGITYLIDRWEQIKNALPKKRHVSYSPKLRMRPKNIIVVFDIPEKRRGYRNWLRVELVCLGFTQLQKSVWFGPAPLPKEFFRSLDELKLLQFLKFFKASAQEIV